MKNLRQRFERFCFANRNRGVRNLMLYLCSGAGLIALMSLIDSSNALYNLLCFNRVAILQGQIWRLVTYPLCYSAGSVFMTALTLFCYYSMGQAIENTWGTFRFNLFYLTGVILMDIWCMIFGGQANVTYLNLSLFLSYATLYPNSQFLLFFIIPVKAWIFALIDLLLVVYGLFAYSFPSNLFSVISLANYFLFFGKDVVNVIPLSWRVNAGRLLRKKPTVKKKDAPKVVPFPTAGSYEATVTTVKAPYTHKCTVCGRTDISNPELEFRYCSRCKGYYCYCEDHISNHEHVQ